MPEAAIAPPPPKPAAPKPAPAPPAPKPAPKPQPPSRPQPPKLDDKGAFDDAFADLDAIEAKDTGAKGPQKQEKKPKPEPEKKDERKSSEEDDAGSAEELPASDEKEDKAKDDEKAKASEETKPVRAAELRTAYEKSKLTIKEKDAEITRLKGELESKAKAVDPEKNTLKERLAVTEKKLAEYEDEIRFTNYKNHPEFKEKYETPYHNAFAKALADFEQLNVTDDEGNKRLATRNDLDAMLRMSVAQVDELATEKFGASAPRVIRHVEKLRDLAEAYHSALEDAKTKGGEREKNRALESQKQAEQYSKLWQTENEEAAKKYPHLFSPKEEDEDGNKALERGYQLADAVFQNRDKYSPEQLVKMDAAVRNKAAAFHRLTLESNRKDARIAELEKALEEYEKSDPETEGDDPPKKTGGGSWEDDAFAELDAIDRKSRK